VQGKPSLRGKMAQDLAHRTLRRAYEGQQQQLGSQHTLVVQVKQRHSIIQQDRQFWRKDVRIEPAHL
jgi:hypothetical protein